jgi:BlaI family transcriptional regulator, penicillinase repressor
MKTSDSSPIHRLGPLQLQILKVLWEEGEATVAQVHQAVQRARSFAYTTIATMLRKMETRGLVEHRLEGRLFIYRAMVGEKAVSRSLASDLLDRVFEGSLSTLVNHLLTTREVSRDEISRLEHLLEEQKRRS